MPGALSLALNHSTLILRCGAHGAHFRYFSRASTLRCFDALARSSNASSFRLLLLGPSNLGFIWKAFTMDDEWSPGRDLTKCPSQHARHKVSAPKGLLGHPFGNHRVDYHRWNYVTSEPKRGPPTHPPEVAGTCDGPQLVRRCWDSHTVCPASSELPSSAHSAH